MDRISLYYKDGKSDKEYHATVEPKGDGFVVNFAFGRRGSTLQTGTKTQTPVPYEKAKAIHDKLVQEKTAKGYSPGESGTPYHATDNEERATGILPQLLNAIEEEEMERLISDDAFCMQQKFDGKRILIQKTGTKTIGINRRGLSIGLPEPLIHAANTVSVPFVMDGEACGDKFFAFDLLEMNGADHRGLAYGERLDLLVKMLAHRPRPIQAVESAKETKSKRALIDRLQKENAEGVVFKRNDARYIAGRPHSGGNQLKFKFHATASCIVARVNAKRSVALELLDSAGKPIGVGNVTISAKHAVLPKGAIIEVRYLYAFPKGSLFQPVFIGIRDDIDQSACTVAQVKFKAEGEQEEEEG